MVIADGSMVLDDKTSKVILVATLGLAEPDARYDDWIDGLGDVDIVWLSASLGVGSIVLLPEVGKSEESVTEVIPS